MKIVVVARTRNEEKNISRFCRCYSWVDKILIADGGSDDNTIQNALEFPNVSIRRFAEKVTNDGGETWRNPHGRHMNFMFDWAESEGADWIIFDDVDCLPTVKLQEAFRSILENTDKNCVYLNRVYLYGNDKYFRDITIPGKLGLWGSSETTSIYAWKSGLVRASEENPWEHVLIVDERKVSILRLSPPHSVIHDFFPNDGTRLEKVKFYALSGEQPKCSDPRHVYKDIVPIEDWMEYDK